MFDDTVTHEILRIFRSVSGDSTQEIDLETDIIALELNTSEYYEVINELENEFTCEIEETAIETIGDIVRVVMENGIY